MLAVLIGCIPVHYLDFYGNVSLDNNILQIHFIGMATLNISFVCTRCIVKYWKIFLQELEEDIEAVNCTCGVQVDTAKCSRPLPKGIACALYDDKVITALKSVKIMKLTSQQSKQGCSTLNKWRYTSRREGFYTLCDNMNGLPI